VTENHASSERRSLPADMAVEEWLAPDRWPLRSFTLPAEAAKGAILLLGGRGDFFEKYLEAFGHWRREGWTVSGFDWRGQGGSGRTYSGPGSHIGDFSTYVTDLEAYWSQWRPEAAGPRVVIAHSMGAHVVLKALVDRSITPAGIVERDGPREEALARVDAFLGRLTACS
jgi:lysophospholipase